MDRLLADILEKHQRGETLSAREQELFDQLKLYLQQRWDTSGKEKAYETFLQIAVGTGDPVTEQPGVATLQAKATPSPSPSRLRVLSRRWAAAAAVLLVASAGLILYHHLYNSSQVMIVKGAPAPIPPGSQGAILTLSNGRQIILDSLGNGLVATQNGTHVTMNNGKLSYSKDKPAIADLMFNTITTPRGRKFQLSLPDGTKVWLNAATKLTFPTAFTGRERQVSVSGEAYFEVVKNAAMPFRVNVNDKTEVEVLGTNFNVNAYADDARQYTTLLEGSVRVIRGQEKALLLPGQQASVPAATAANIDVHSANIDKVMAWKNDLFNFDGATLADVMNQVARWYDVDIVYEKGVPPFEFGGKIRRDLTLDHLLEFLGGAGVHFRIDGRRVIVLP